MKMIVFVALLAAAGCSKKKSDCEVLVGKGIANFAPQVKTSAASPQIQQDKLDRLDKLKGALTQRCTTDKWAPEAVACFASVSSLPAMQACQAKLTAEQHTKLNEDLREIMMSSMGGRTPGGAAEHPSTPPGSGPGEPGGSGAAPAGAGAAPTGAAPAGAGAAPEGSAAAPAPAGSAAPEPAAGSSAK